MSLLRAAVPAWSRLLTTSEESAAQCRVEGADGRTLSSPLCGSRLHASCHARANATVKGWRSARRPARGARRAPIKTWRFKIVIVESWNRELIADVPSVCHQHDPHRRPMCNEGII
ncbi:hypothetical protein IE81DRAFT_196426 [Ceraceosorus guamensis]|uniref:Uncharacterized protein n=1 Tax=Ceraceosorus guamensis TaxID=1522189 RepID=A0A316VUA0_9BASI|nr:hypothetical protein IE81DRAFT_196426 [Ceraceosorus guamensis]PWN41072.1 hypothetical protein IE81DRAFT_196426 [Ceraceosorus guamensis]